MSNLSELLPAGAGAKSADFVASGTLGSGVTVALQSDGTVEAVSLISFSSGSPTVFSTTSGLDGYPSAAYDLGAGKIVQMWRDSASGYLGRASVGTISGSSVSFGTPSTFSGSGRLEQNFNCVYDPTNEKVVLVYPNIDNSAYPTAVVATVSGTSLSFGTPVVIESNAANWSNNQRKPGVTYDTNSNKVVVIYYNNLGQGSAIVGTVSGTTTSWGTRTNFFTSPIGSISATFDSTTNKVIAAHADLGSNLGYVWLGTVSGTSITMGSQTQFLAANARWTGIQYIPSLQKSILVYTDVGNSSIGTAVILDTSTGGSISVATPVTYGGETEYNSVVYDTNINQAIVTFKNATDSNRGNQVQGTISGDTVSFTSAETWSTAYANGVVPVYDPVSFKTYVSFLDGNNGGRGSGIVLSPASSNSADFIGITDQAIADTATGAVIVQGGVSDKLSGLTVGADYYVQADGSVASPTVSVPSNINNSTYDNKFLSVVGQELNSTGFRFNTDGTKVYIVGYGNDTVYQYSLSQAFEIDTASYDSVSFSVATQDTNPHGIAFNISGTKMYILGYGNDTVFQYSLSSAFDLSSASYDSVSFSVASQETQPQGIAFNSDGTKMYIVGFTNDTVFQYSLSSSFDLSSASYDSVSFSVAGQDISPSGLCFNSDGSEMYVVGTTSDTIYQYSLSSSFDLSSASYNGASFNVSSEEAIPNDVYMRPDNLKFYVLGRGQDDLLQYSTGVGSVTSVPAGRALSSTSILLEG